MLDLPNSWAGTFEWFSLLAAKVGEMQPLILAFLLAPWILAILNRNALAILVTTLLTVLAFMALQVRADEAYQWGVTLMIGLASLLAVFQSIKLRQWKKQARGAEARAKEALVELESLRERLQREVYWRKAVEGRTARQSPEV